MASILTAKPINVQTKFRGQFSPPSYNLFRVEVSTTLATKLAETFGLQSVNIIINQNASSTQYLYYRYFLQGDPFRYMDVTIGIDQAEVVFSNPATIPELISEFDKVWKIILECLSPNIRQSYFEATLHCEADGVKEFLNKAVQVPTNPSQSMRVSADPADIHKGYSITLQQHPNLSARLSLDLSGSVKDGLYVAFAYFNMATMIDMTAFSQFFNSILVSYRTLQAMCGVQLLERNADGTYSKRN